MPARFSSKRSDTSYAAFSRRLAPLARPDDVVVLLLTGLLLRRQHLEVPDLDAGLRMLFRSRHIHLLFAGLLNLAIGLRFALPVAARARRIAVAGSVLLLVSLFLLFTAFVLEPMGSGRFGPVRALGVLAACLGVISHSLAASTRRIAWAATSCSR